MKLKFVAAAVLAVVGSASHAAIFNLGAIDNTVQNIGNSFAANVAIFSDTFNFSITDPGSIQGLAIVFPGAPFFAINNFTAELYSGVTLLGSIAGNVPVTFNGLTAGAYSLNVFGNPAGQFGGGYGGFVASVTAPVPEPETYAMMLAGLGALGFLARRRRND